MDHAKLAELQGPDSIFAGLSAEDWADITSRAVQINFVKGKELLVQGDPGDMMLILTQGTARVSMLTGGGREIVLAYAEPGAVLGEIALLDGGDRIIVDLRHSFTLRKRAGFIFSRARERLSLAGAASTF